MGKIIEEIKNLADIKIKTLFIIFLGVWTIDFLTTLWGVAIIKTMDEANPIPAFFYNMGWYGWIIFYLIAMIVFFLFSLMTINFKNSLSKNYIKNNKKDRGWIIVFIGITLFCTLEFFVIINNLYWIFF